MTQTNPTPSSRKPVRKKVLVKDFKARWRVWWHKNQTWIILFFLLMMALLLVLYNRIFISIHSGEQGVLWKRFSGTETHRIYDEGLHIISPLDIMHVYTVRKQIIQEELVLLSNDGLNINIKFSARFYPNLSPPEKAGDPLYLPLLHQRLGPNYMETVVRPEVISAFRSVIGNYTPEEIYAKDEKGLLEQIIEVARVQLQGGIVIREDENGNKEEELVEGNYIILDDMLMHKLNLPEKVEMAISQKLTHKHEYLAYEHIKLKEREEAERRTIEANGIRMFQETAGISILQWHGIEATKELAKSNNAKFIVIGNDSKSLPVILNMEGNNEPRVEATARNPDLNPEPGEEAAPNPIPRGSL